MLKRANGKYIPALGSQFVLSYDYVGNVPDTQDTKVSNTRSQARGGLSSAASERSDQLNENDYLCHGDCKWDTNARRLPGTLYSIVADAAISI